MQQRPSSGQPQLQSGGVGAEAAYARLEALCAAIKTELQRDLHIHDQAILPSSVNLPQITAAEYCRVGLLCPLQALLCCWLRGFGKRRLLSPPDQHMNHAIERKTSFGNALDHLENLALLINVHMALCLVLSHHQLSHADLCRCGLIVSSCFMLTLLSG